MNSNYFLRIDEVKTMKSSKIALQNKMIFAFILLLEFFSGTAFASNLPQQTWVIDKPVVIEDLNELEGKSIETFQWNHITYVPARMLANEFEVSIEYIPVSQEIILNNGHAELKFLLNNESALILNSQGAKTIPVNSYCLGEISYIPLRFAAENLGLDVVYNAKNGMIEISGRTGNPKEKFTYSLDKDLSKILNAIDEYNKAAIVELKSNQTPQQSITLQRDGLNITMHVLEGEKEYQVVERNQWNSITGNIQSSRTIYEIQDGKLTPMRLLGGETFFNIGNLGIDNYQCYCISEWAKESIETGGYKYNIKKIGDTEVNISLFFNEDGQIYRYIICESPDNIISDFTVKILE